MMREDASSTDTGQTHGSQYDHLDSCHTWQGKQGGRNSSSSKRRRRRMEGRRKKEEEGDEEEEEEEIEVERIKTRRM